MTKPNLYVAMFVLCFEPWLPAVAHETDLYESLEHIHIGRVFLSPAERQHLEKNRNATSPLGGVPSATAGDKTATGNDRAAGYIVSGSGHTRVWKEGRFVVVDTSRPVRFPGDVKVTRAADTTPNAAASEDESSSAGAEDDAD